VEVSQIALVLLLEVLGDLTDLLGPGKVAVRLSPTTRDSITYYGAVDSDPDALYGHAISALNSLPLAYILLTEPRWTGGAKADSQPERDSFLNQPLINSIR